MNDTAPQAQQRRQRGRPPSPGVEDKALTAARALISEYGYEDTTIDAIAASAGVTKAAIYRRWPNKARLVYDAMFTGGTTANEVPDTGNVRDDLLDVLRQNARPMRDPAVNALLARVIVEAATDPALSASLRADLFEPRAHQISARVSRAVERGELKAEIDAALVPALLTGPLQYLLLVHNSPLSDDDLRRIVDATIGPYLLHPRR